MTARSLRLFVAASLPEEHLAWVGERVSELRRRWPEARWVPTENQHVTLKFLGSTPEERVPQVTAACEAVRAAHAGAPLRLARLGGFPSVRRARVLWIGLEDPEGLLRSLAVGLDAALAGLGFEAESRPYSAHLTIARFKSPVALGDLPDLPSPPGSFMLQDFDLWRSHLSPRGARYERLESFSLG